jgi:diguanylate cyclase (GGDEF)-like protein/PAS domain S-box-containing protein
MGRKKRVLVVDDEKDFLEIYTRILEIEGFSVITAAGGAAAIDAVEKERPHAVLLDLKPPVADGVETFERIKAVDPHLPVLILTAYGDMDTAVKVLKLGAYDFLQKPPDTGRLVVALRNAVEEYCLRAAQKLTEEHLHKVSRELKAVSECFRALLCAGDESRLLEDVCRIIVATGGYLMAWVGYAECDEEKTVRPVAQTGFDISYLESVKISWSQDSPIGQGPTGNAIRLCKHQICRNILEDPLYAPWKEEASKRGYVSSIALPLIFQTGTLGSLNIYSSRDDAFHPDEVRLLSMLAENLSFGISFLRTRVNLDMMTAQFRSSHILLQTLMDGVTDSIYFKDDKHRFVKVNRTKAENSGATQEDMIGKTDFDYLPEESASKCLQDDEAVLKAGRFIQGKVERIERKDGSENWVSISKTPWYDDTGRIIGTIGIARDITNLKLAEIHCTRNYETQKVLNDILHISMEPTELKTRLGLILQKIIDIPWLSLQHKGAIFLVQGIPGEITMNTQIGFGQKIISRCENVPFDRCHCGKAAETRQVVFSACVDDAHEILYDGIAPHGHYCVPILSGGKTLGVLNLYVDHMHARNENEETFLTSVAATLAGIIERSRAEERLHVMALYDALTGLPNRTLFFDRYGVALAEAERYNYMLAILFMDLDNFKSINDTMGHDAGDAVLVETARRLKTLSRHSDTVARIGGDEFVMLVPRISNAAAASAVAKKIVESLAAPLQLNGGVRPIEVSIGISIYPTDGADVDALLRRADTAMYHAKREGGSVCRLYGEIKTE